MRHIRTLLLLLFLMVYAPFGQAQSIKKAYAHMQNNRLEDANEIFGKLIEKQKDEIPARYGMMQLYLMGLPMKDPALLRNIRIFRNKYARIDSLEKQNLYADFEISDERVNILLQDIGSQLLKKVLPLKQLTDIESFIQDFNGTPIAVEAIKIRDLWAYEEMMVENTFQSYEIYMAKYPESVYTPEVKKKYEQSWAKLFRTFTHQGEWQLVEEFKTKYNAYPYKDSIIIELNLASLAKALTLTRGVNEINRTGYIEYIKKAAPRELAYVALMRLAEPYLLEKNYTGAIALLDSFKTYFSPQTRIDSIIHILNQADKPIHIQNAGTGVNTTRDEYSPVLSANGKRLYFCTQKRKENLGGEDVFYSELGISGWGKAAILSGINTEGNEAPESLTADENYITLFSGANNGDLLISEYTPNGWITPKEFLFFNTAYFEGDGMISPNGGALIFSSDRPGGVGRFQQRGNLYHGALWGNTDIWISFRTETGWTEPMNLGTDINTPYAENSAYLHPDMRTLYFSSDGHPGLGRLDVFMTYRMYDTSWVHWTKPVNLGKLINTPDDEWGYKITTNGKQAYFASRQNRNHDIFFMDLPDIVKPKPIVAVTGKLVDKFQKPILGKIVWEDTQTGKIVGITTPNPFDGTYYMALTEGKTYTFYFVHPDYYPAGSQLDLTQGNTPDSNLEIQLVRTDSLLNGQKSVALRNIFFNFDSYELNSNSFPELNRLVNFLNNNPGIRIEVSGHTDFEGTEAYNQTLSQNRANAIRDYLLKKGIPPMRITAVGYGTNFPIVTGGNRQKQKANRRVEFKVLTQ